MNNMAYKERYERALPQLLSNPEVCVENREVFRGFFEYEEYKLKRQNNLRALDEGCFNTLYSYILMFKTVNRWFNNKPWKNLTREDIKQVYDDLEDGIIVNSRGTPYRGLRSYYNKVLKSKPFRLAGKAELAREVIEFSIRHEKPVRFISEEAFKNLVSVVANPKHLLLFWLAWDIGENVGALLQLTKRDFTRQPNEHNGEIEYLVNLPQSKIKRSRLSRSEPTLYPETVRYADMVLGSLSEDAAIFGFGHRQALKIIHTVARKTGIVCKPNGDRPTWKDLRSGMACHLLKCGWSREEVDARLGHTPNSSALNAYINFLAIDRSKPKKRMVESTVTELQEALRREKLATHNFKIQNEDNAELRQMIVEMHSEIGDLRDTVKLLLKRSDSMKNTEPATICGN